MYKPYLLLLPIVGLTGCIGSAGTSTQNSSAKSSVSTVTSQSSAAVSVSSVASSLSSMSSVISSSSLSSVEASSSAPAAPNAGQNILTSDGTFIAGQQDFTFFFQQEALPSSINWNNSAAINIGGLSSMIWHGQIHHAVAVEENTQYTVCLEASAEAPRSFNFEIDANQDGEFAKLNRVAIGAAPGAVTSSVGTDVQQFKYTFFAAATDATARLVLSVGLSDINITFDNIGMYLGDQCGDPSNIIEQPDTSLPVASIPKSGRTDCPAPPPAQIGKAAATDRTVALSSSDLKNFLKEQTPFVAKGWTIPWNLHEPDAAANNTTNERFPLLVVLHGGYGSEGADGNVTRDVARYALGLADNGLLTQSNLADFPAYVVTPHCRMSQAGGVMLNGQLVDQPACQFVNNEWASGGGANFELQQQPSLAGGAVIELVEHMIKTYDIDPSRIYLTGNSMGGGGTWEFLVRRPDLFAAAVPVSGHTPSPLYFDAIANSKLPIWAFAGSNDFTNPVTDTRAAIAAINEANGCAWLTEYANTGHDDALWSSPYLESELWSWLFAQKLPAANNAINDQTKVDYEAPKTAVAPAIDGQAEALWDAAPWEAIDTPWLFEDLTAPESAADFSGRYKALWDANKLYLLVEITDDQVIDWTAEPTDTYWHDDTLELFIDEDRSGGLHRNHSSTPDANDANAFAYHLSTLGDNLDNFNRQRTIFGDDHITYRRVEISPTQSVWEMAITLWGDDYTLEGNHTPVTLTAGKVMGFTASYIDTDGNNGQKREHFIGSINSPGHQNNEGFVNADGLGSLRLVD